MLHGKCHLFRVMRLKRSSSMHDYCYILSHESRHTDERRAYMEGYVASDSSGTNYKPRMAPPMSVYLLSLHSTTEISAQYESRLVFLAPGIPLWPIPENWLAFTNDSSMNRTSCQYQTFLPASTNFVDSASLGINIIFSLLCPCCIGSGASGATMPVRDEELQHSALDEQNNPEYGYVMLGMRSLRRSEALSILTSWRFERTAVDLFIPSQAQRIPNTMIT